MEVQDYNGFSKENFVKNRWYDNVRYFFALILLRIVVLMSFVFPAVEIGRLHTIQKDIFYPNAKPTTPVIIECIQALN